MLTQESPSVVARWPILRIQCSTTMQVQLLSADWLRLSTHFNGVTFLCPEVEECDACNLLPSRPYWYLPVLCLSTQRHSILELSSHASADLEQKVRFTGLALRAGVQVELARRSAKAPVRVECLSQAENPPLAKFHEWATALMALYKLPPLHLGESLDAYGVRVLDRVLQRAHLQAEILRASKNGRPSSRR